MKLKVPFLFLTLFCFGGLPSAFGSVDVEQFQMEVDRAVQSKNDGQLCQLYLLRKQDPDFAESSDILEEIYFKDRPELKPKCEKLANFINTASGSNKDNGDIVEGFEGAVEMVDYSQPDGMNEPSNYTYDASFVDAQSTEVEEATARPVGTRQKKRSRIVHNKHQGVEGNEENQKITLALDTDGDNDFNDESESLCQDCEMDKADVEASNKFMGDLKKAHTNASWYKTTMFYVLAGGIAFVSVGCVAIVFVCTYKRIKKKKKSHHYSMYNPDMVYPACALNS